MREQFTEVRLSKQNWEHLHTINAIIKEYQADGYTLTLRQLYYQLVSRDIIPNQQREYSKLSRVLKKGRMGGIVDWDAIEDRLRKIQKVSTWEGPADVLQAALDQYQIDRLEGQDVYLEVWVEKDALSQVVQRAADKFQVPVLVNRGYGSVSAMYDTYKRLYRKLNKADEAIIFYLGDHDPSGLDMVRDIKDRLREFLETHQMDHMIRVNHIALTMDQIEQYNPPPNPAKVTDSRAADYIQRYGPTSWEVDALEPHVLNKLITDNIKAYLNERAYDARVEEEWLHKDQLREIIDKF